MDKRPIGIFDSGLGGLSAVKAVLEILPNENIVYFGDTARVPYGSRSNETIEKFAKEDIEFLQQFDCKLIMAACGTVSSVAQKATSAIEEPFIGVVKPASKAAAKATRNGVIGVMGTAATINSGSYSKEIAGINPDAKVIGVSCPLLVTLVENNWIDEDNYIAREIIKRYITPLMRQGADTIILGCTHFPHLAPIIQSVAGADVVLIDTGLEAAREARWILSAQDMANSADNIGAAHYYVSDKTQNFSAIAQTLLGRDISGEITFMNVKDRL